MEFQLFSAGLSIILIDLVLSGDNAVVIGMAAHRLPPRQRKMAIIFGAGAAIVLRIALTAVATLLLLLPWVRLVGGALLLWIGFKLLKEEEEQHEGTGGSERLFEAISTIIVADVVMSVDNILGVAAAAHGDIGLLIFGLVLSMIIMLAGGSLIATMIDKFWWLVYLGSAVIIWTGVRDDVRRSVHRGAPPPGPFVGGGRVGRHHGRPDGGGALRPPPPPEDAAAPAAAGPDRLSLAKLACPMQLSDTPAWHGSRVRRGRSARRCRGRRRSGR